jgi:hypothetical protein
MVGVVLLLAGVVCFRLGTVAATLGGEVTYGAMVFAMTGTVATELRGAVVAGAGFATMNDVEAAVDDTFRLSVTVKANVCDPFDITEGLIVNEPPSIDVDPLDQHPVDDEYVP